MKRTRTEFYNFPRKFVPRLKKAAVTALRAVGKAGSCEISVVMVPDAGIKKLNREYRRMNRVTDVISFRLSKDPLCGDIYISSGRSKKQAKDAGNSWEAELCYLVIHGILHLFDYTDYKPSQRKKMFAVQDRLFKMISV